MTLREKYGRMSAPMPVSSSVEVWAVQCEFDHVGGCRSHIVIDGGKAVQLNSYNGNSTLGAGQDWSNPNQMTLEKARAKIVTKGYERVDPSDCHWIQLPAAEEVPVEDTLSGGI